MKLTLFDSDINLCKAWKKEFSDTPEIEAFNCTLATLPSHDAVVTAGNSYGIMDGGIDLAMRERFGIALQDKIQWSAVHLFGGRIPIGECINVPTEEEAIPIVIYAPSMCIPKPIIAKDIMVVFYSVLRTIQECGFESVACCGIGTGVGGVEAKTAAHAMHNAWDLLKGI